MYNGGGGGTKSGEKKLKSEKKSISWSGRGAKLSSLPPSLPSGSIRKCTQIEEEMMQVVWKLDKQKGLFKKSVRLPSVPPEHGET